MQCIVLKPLRQPCPNKIAITLKLWRSFLSDPKLRDHCRRGVRKVIRPEAVNDFKKRMSSRHSRTDWLMNSQRLWWHAQDLCCLKPNQIPVRRAWQLIPHQEAVGKWELLEGGKSVFSKNGSSHQGEHASLCGCLPKNIWAVQVRLYGCKRERKKEGEVKRETEMGD